MTNFDIAQATIELFGGLVCLMLAVIIMMNGDRRKSWKMYKRMLFSVSGIFFFEAFAYIVRGNTNRVNVYANHICNFAVFFFNLVLMALFVNYMYHLFEEKGIEPGRIYRRLVYFFLAVNLILLIVNVFTGWMYYFDAENLYHRNIGWYLYTALSLICILISCVMSIRYRRFISKAVLSSLLLYSLTPLIAILIQTFVYGISITNLGIFVALIIMLVVYLKDWSRSKNSKDRERRSVDIIVLLIIMTISMSASVISCVISINRISNKNSESHSIMLAHMVSDAIKNEFVKPIVVAETMGNDYSLKQYMKESAQAGPASVEQEIASYLESIKSGFGYQMVFAVCDASRAYYTYDGITKYIDTDKNDHDIWYKLFLEEGKHYDLDVDTDEANHWELSVFVNVEMLDENGDFLGICGVGVEMSELQKLVREFEEDYNVKINLIDRQGLIQVDSDTERIEQDVLDNSYFDQVDSKDFLVEHRTKSNRLTKYMEDLDWYLVVEDNNLDAFNVLEIVSSSIIIFMISLLMMGIVFAIIFIREKKTSRELEERKKIAMTDEMTGLCNYRAFQEDVKHIVDSGRICEITMIMMDLNGLKTTNDTFGHMAGDELIIGAAKCMQNAMRKFGKIYRIGGDEFVALLRCTKQELEDMLRTFDHITERWKGTYQSELSISKGVVIGEEHKDLIFDEIKELADRLMYQEKEQYYKNSGKQRRKK